MPTKECQPEPWLLLIKKSLKYDIVCGSRE